MKKILSIAATALVILIAVQHFGFLVLEMFYWDRPIGRDVFGTTEQFAIESKVLAANQGLYNGFLSAGILWGLLRKNREMVLFLLGCVVAAGIFGGATAGPKIYYVQALPAAIAFLLFWRTGNRST